MKQSILIKLAKINGSVAIANGMATFPDGSVVNLALASLLEKASKDKLAEAYAGLMTRKLGGKVYAYYDEDTHKVTIHGSQLPTNPDLIKSHGYPATWEMMDHHSVSKCQGRLLEAMNDPAFQAEVVQLLDVKAA